MTVLLTGCSGLIGSYLARHLLVSGRKVIGISRTPPFDDIYNHPLFSFFSCDLTAKEELARLSSIQEVDVIINCASQQPRKDLDLLAYSKINTMAIDYLLNWMKERKLKNLIHFSTVVFHEFYESDKVSINEKSAVNPPNYYALSKYCGELVLKMQAQNFDAFNIVALRLPSIIIENQLGGIIDTYFDHAINNRNLELYSEGRYKRNLIHIDEIISAVELVLTKINKLQGYHPIIIGAEDSWTMKQIAEYIFEQTHSAAKVIPSSHEVSVKGHWNFDLLEANKLIGFTAGSIKNGLDKYIYSKMHISKK